MYKDKEECTVFWLVVFVCICMVVWGVSSTRSMCSNAEAQYQQDIAVK